MLNQVLYGKEDAPEDKQQDPIGLVENPDGVPFQCGTCNYFQDGTCSNPDPRLSGQKVQPEWCCNDYEHDDMRTVIP